MPQIEKIEGREDIRGPYLLVSMNVAGPCRAGSTEHVSHWFIQREGGKVQCFQCDTIETARMFDIPRTTVEWGRG